MISDSWEDDIDVMEKTMDKNADQLIDDYLSNEATKGRMTSEPPTFTVVDQRKLPRAEIEALPLKDKEKAEAAAQPQNSHDRRSIRDAPLLPAFFDPVSIYFAIFPKKWSS